MEVKVSVRSLHHRLSRVITSRLSKVASVSINKKRVYHSLFLSPTHPRLSAQDIASRVSLISSSSIIIDRVHYHISLPKSTDSASEYPPPPPSAASSPHHASAAPAPEPRDCPSTPRQHLPRRRKPGWRYRP